jgi:hypothetical protein
LQRRGHQQNHARQDLLAAFQAIHQHRRPRTSAQGNAGEDNCGNLFPLDTPDRPLVPAMPVFKEITVLQRQMQVLRPGRHGDLAQDDCYFFACSGWDPAACNFDDLLASISIRTSPPASGCALLFRRQEPR